MPKKKKTALSEAIYNSSDYSTDSSNCITAIRADLKLALSPIVRSLKDHPQIARKAHSIFVTDAFASKLMEGIWPGNKESSIELNLCRKLEPLAKSLDKIGSPAATRAAKRLRALYPNAW